MTGQIARRVAGAVATAVVAWMAFGASTRAQGAPCHPAARDLRVSFQPVENSGNGTSVRAELTLANRSGGCALPGSGWRLYFNSVRQPLAVLGGAVGDAARQALAAQGLSVARADVAQSGDYYVLTPNAGFEPLQPAQRRVVTVQFELWTILKTDAPAGWHIAFDGGPARWVPAKALLDPSDPKQTTAFSGDKNPVQTAGTRFAQNTASLMPLGLQDTIVPRPLRAAGTGGVATLGGAGTRIRYAPSLRGEAGYLKSALQDVLRGRVGLGGGRRGSLVRLRVEPGLDVDGDGAADREGYTLRVSRRGVRIAGADAAGVLYG